MNTIIINLGMDVHTTNYTLCCYTFYNDTFFAETPVAPDYREVLKYMDTVRKAQKLSTGADVKFVCGYEAGCFGYTLYHQLTQAGHECVIPAPSTIPSFKTGEIKTNKRDARKLAHMKYLHGITLEGCAQDALEEYLLTYTELTGKIERFDQRIEEIAVTQEYQEKVKKLRCLMGIRPHTALAVVVETGDFRRFASADQYASYLGITLGEHSSGDTRRRTGITHAGNSHIRRLLVEASQGYGRGRVGYKFSYG
ncbi:MAG: IS110 family transposase [Lachnospiraceae bacterium]|nr:IS110 family transposase [Lachnospiraceae bacterium]